MSEELLIRHCSPTLAGLKTGNLFPCVFPDAAQARACLRRWNEQLRGKGLKAVALRPRGGHALVYVYRPSRLAADLARRESRDILRECGCDSCQPERCLAHLARRLSDGGDFPHEIGLFLGYPPEDVRGFMRDANGQKYTGVWKVYGNVDAARKTFTRYKKCTEIYCRLYEAGRPLSQLTVAG